MVDAYIDPPFAAQPARCAQVPQLAAKARRLFPSGSPFGLGVLLISINGAGGSVGGAYASPVTISGGEIRRRAGYLQHPTAVDGRFTSIRKVANPTSAATAASGSSNSMVRVVARRRPNLYVDP